jgi:hypothetical protein
VILQSLPILSRTAQQVGADMKLVSRVIMNPVAGMETAELSRIEMPPQVKELWATR